MNLVDRVASEADKFRLGRLLKWLVVAPFYAIGVLIALVWVLGVLAVGAVKVGIVETRAKVKPRPTQRATPPAPPGGS